MTEAETEIERMHDLLDQTVTLLSDISGIVTKLEATNKAQANAKTNALKQIGMAIGSIFYAGTFLPSDPREIAEVPGKPDPDLTPEQRSRVDQLTDDQIRIIDDSLMANASVQWRKMARVIGSAMTDNSELIQNVPDVFYAERLRKLVKDGKLESEGDLDYMRFSEVRLPR